VHHAERQRCVSSRIDGKMFVSQLPGAVQMRIDDVKLGPIASRFDDEWPQVDVRSENVRTPGNDELGVAKLFRLSGEPVAQRSRQRGAARG